MVDVIHSPLSPALALAALEQYARDWRESSLPPVLRARRIVELTFSSTADGFCLELNTANRRGVQCIGQLSATSFGSAVTYEIVSDRSSRFRRVAMPVIWLGVLLYAFLRRAVTLSLLTLAATMLAFAGYNRPSSKLRVGVYSMLCSALQGSDLPAAT